MNETLMNLTEAPPPSPERRFPRVAWACAVSPFVLLFVFITLGVHVRLGLGHWPTPMVEVYHSTAFDVHEWVLILCLGFTVYLAGPLWAVCLAVRSLRPRSLRVAVSQFVSYGLGWLVIVAVLVSDPTTYSEWFLD